MVYKTTSHMYRLTHYNCLRCKNNTKSKRRDLSLNILMLNKLNKYKKK